MFIKETWEATPMTLYHLSHVQNVCALLNEFVNLRKGREGCEKIVYKMLLTTNLTAERGNVGMQAGAEEAEEGYGFPHALGTNVKVSLVHTCLLFLSLFALTRVSRTAFGRSECSALLQNGITAFHGVFQGYFRIVNLQIESHDT